MLVRGAVGVRRASLGAGVVFMVELVSGGVATAASTTVVTSADRFLSGLEAAFIGVAALAALGALGALLLTPGRERVEVRAEAAPS